MYKVDTDTGSVRDLLKVSFDVISSTIWKQISGNHMDRIHNIHEWANTPFVDGTRICGLWYY